MATVLERADIDDGVYESVPQEPDRTVLRLPSGLIDSEQFFAICRLNDDLRLEREANGDIVIMPPTAGSSGLSNAEIIYQLKHWHRRTRLGYVFDSSAGYELPNGRVMSPDASWIPAEQWDALTPEQKDRFLPFFPVFAVELMSPSDRLPATREKMKTYLEHGTRLAWLINPKKRQVEIHEPGKAPVLLDNPKTLAGDPVLPGFVLDLTEVWE